MLGTSKILMSLAAMTGLLMQTGTDPGCTQNLGLFPGFAGLATPGVGIATGLNTTPGNINDLINPPDNGQFPEDPFDDFEGDPLANLKGTTLTLRNLDEFDMEVQFLIDGFLRIFIVRAGEIGMVILEETDCVEAINLLSVTVREQFTGLLVDNVDFLLDSTVDWPGPLGPLRCGDTVRYSFNVIDIVDGINLPDIIFFGDRVVMDVQTSRIGGTTTTPQNP
jgi:hypothetical protein